MPAGSDGRSSVSLPLSYRPLGSRVVAGVAAVALVTVVAVLWVNLSDAVQAKFSLFQRITLIAVFAALIAVLYALFRTSATADVVGLRVVNGYKTREFEWAEVIAISFTPNRPWAWLDLADGASVAVMAIQAADGDRASRSARELAGLIAERSRPDRS
ncbi:MAG: PH domain-containing protein [Propionibacteriales bacterium]|nr:PH domain-containing protein [Propionibacteriales bacterium]